jgi:hypothetical protein
MWMVPEGVCEPHGLLQVVGWRVVCRLGAGVF